MRSTRTNIHSLLTHLPLGTCFPFTLNLIRHRNGSQFNLSLQAKRVPDKALLCRRSCLVVLRKLKFTTRVIVIDRTFPVSGIRSNDTSGCSEIHLHMFQWQNERNTLGLSQSVNLAFIVRELESKIWRDFNLFAVLSCRWSGKFGWAQPSCLYTKLLFPFMHKTLVCTRVDLVGKIIPI